MEGIELFKLMDPNRLWTILGSVWGKDGDYHHLSSGLWNNREQSSGEGLALSAAVTLHTTPSGFSGFTKTRITEMIVWGN